MNKDLLRFKDLTDNLATTLMAKENRDEDFMPFLEEYFTNILELRFSMGELIDYPHEHLVYRNVTFIILLGQILSKIKPNQAAFDKTRDAMVAAYKDALENIQSYYFKDIYKDGKFIKPKSLKQVMGELDEPKRQASKVRTTKARTPKRGLISVEGTARVRNRKAAK